MKRSDPRIRRHNTNSAFAAPSSGTIIGMVFLVLALIGLIAAGIVNAGGAKAVSPFIPTTRTWRSFISRMTTSATT